MLSQNRNSSAGSELCHLRKLMLEALESRSLLTTWGGSCLLETTPLGDPQMSDHQLVAVADIPAGDESAVSGQAKRDEDSSSAETSYGRPTLGGLVAEGEASLDAAESVNPWPAGNGSLATGLTAESEAQPQQLASRETSVEIGFGPQLSQFQPVVAAFGRDTPSPSQPASTPDLQNTGAISQQSINETSAAASEPGNKLNDATNSAVSLASGILEDWNNFRFDAIQPEALAQQMPFGVSRAVDQQIVLASMANPDRIVGLLNSDLSPGDDSQREADTYQDLVEQPAENQLHLSAHSTSLGRRVGDHRSENLSHRAAPRPSSRLIRQLLRLGGGMLPIEAKEDFAPSEADVVETADVGEDTSPPLPTVLHMEIARELASIRHEQASAATDLPGGDELIIDAMEMEADAQPSWLLHARSLLAVFASGLGAIFVGVRKQKRFDETERARLEKLT